MSHNKKKATAGPRRAARGQEDAVAFSTVVKSAAKALPLTLILGLLLLFALTALLLATKDPAGHHKSAGIVALFFTAVAGGALAALFHQRRAPFFCGVAEGIFLLLLTLPAPLLLPRTWQHGIALPVSLCLHAALLPLCVLGALLVSRTPGRKRKRR